MVESPTAFRQNIIDSLDIFPFYDAPKIKRRKSLVEELQGPTEEEIRQKAHEQLLKRTAFGICCIHSNVVLRGDYPGIGWNCPYAFSPEDLKVSFSAIKLLHSGNRSINFESLVIVSVNVCMAVNLMTYRF